MLKYIFAFFFVSSAIIFPQRGFSKGDGKKHELNINKPVLIEPNIVPSDSIYICYFSYKIPFNNFLFLKDGDNFTGGISLKLEVHNDKSYLKSQTVNKKITVGSYDLTNSDTDYLEGLIEIALKEGSYTIKPSLTIDNLNKDIFIPPFPIEVKSYEPSIILNPIVINKDKYSYKGETYYRIVNAEGFLPYSVNDYNLIIPIADSSVTEITVKINQNGKEILNQANTSAEWIGLGISDLENAVCITNNADGPRVNLFIVDGFSTKLDEGISKITVEAGEAEKEFEINSGWLNKPRTLINPEFAIRILEHVTPGEEISELMDGDEEDYYKNLKSYWEKFDSNKETAFNEVMNEFYQRADYAVSEFSTPNNRDGTNTDRGKIYVKYGKPDEVQRSYSEKDNTIEIWLYKNINKRFMFSDKDGLGNFTLLK
ncbi:MAG: GWxTD domain-containing protein [Melioribacteraceae bacterium]|nr:MAG: GWxTD domain-containing protein [Melioribacteraceae bacterium]